MPWWLWWNSLTSLPWVMLRRSISPGPAGCLASWWRSGWSASPLGFSCRWGKSTPWVRLGSRRSSGICRTGLPVRLGIGSRGRFPRWICRPARGRSWGSSIGSSPIAWSSSGCRYSGRSLGLSWSATLWRSFRSSRTRYRTIYRLRRGFYSKNRKFILGFSFLTWPSPRSQCRIRQCRRCTSRLSPAASWSARRRRPIGRSRWYFPGEAHCWRREERRWRGRCLRFRRGGGCLPRGRSSASGIICDIIRIFQLFATLSPSPCLWLPFSLALA